MMSHRPLDRSGHGKGSANRTADHDKYRSEYERLFGSRDNDQSRITGSNQDNCRTDQQHGGNDSAGPGAAISADDS